MTENTSKGEPVLRFSGFKGNWKSRSVSKDFTKIRNGFVGTATPYYDVSGHAYLQGKNIKNGSVDATGLVFVNDEFHKKQSKSKLKVDDILMVQSGHVGECAVVEAEYENANCHALIVMTPKAGVSSKFYIYFFHSEVGRRLIHKITTGNTIKHILTSDLKPLVVFAPLLEEQQKIASFLSSVDSKITKLREKRELLETYKRGMMQKLFSQELRFKSDDGSEFPEWKVVPLGKCFKERSEKGYVDAELLSVKMNGGVVKRSELDAKNNASEDRSNYKRTLPGDIVYNSMRMWQGASGVSHYEGIVSPAYTVVTPKIGQYAEFYGYIFKYAPLVFMFRRHSQGLTSDTWNLKYPAFSKVKWSLPSSEGEQKRIADCLSTIDKRIDAVAQQIAQMETFKQGLLQKMFV